MYTLTRVTTSYDERLANYIDTLAWVLFRMGSSNNLKEAYAMLIESALLLEPGLAVIHYHIARICLFIIEKKWQARSLKTSRIGNLTETTATDITNLLRSASLHLRHARQMDNKSLQTRIRIMKEKVDYYINIWLDLHKPHEVDKKQS